MGARKNLSVEKFFELPRKVAYNPHVQTIFPNFFRAIEFNHGSKELIPSNDKVLIEAFIKKPRNKRIVIFTHGLEGCAQSGYIAGMRKLLERRKWDTCSWNMRNCGTDHTLTHTVYHAGRTPDLACIVNHLIKNLKYEEVFLVGYSLGGCLTMNYLAKENVPKEVKAAVTVSTPIQLGKCADRLTKLLNKHYQLYFISLMNQKIKRLEQHYPEIYTPLIPPIYKLRNFRMFDRHITAPLSGMKDDEDYYQSHSPEQYILDIKIPVKVITAQDDPFLDKDSMHHPYFYKNPHFKVANLKWGGHVGFWKDFGREFFTENLINDFIESHSESK